jgi:F420-dependent oxidoreductase-like protein
VEIVTTIGNSDGFHDVVKQIAELEKAGLDGVWLGENSGFDAPSRLGYLAAHTETIQIGTNVMPIYTRNPTLMAMTAASLDYLSDGRFNLGLGIGGIELLEGFFGTTFDRSLSRMREYVEICRKVWAKDEPITHDGRHYEIPLPAEKGSGYGQPRMLLEDPVRPRIPIWMAAIGEKSVAQAAEIADGWLPLFWVPEKVGEGWGAALKAGLAKRDPALGPLQMSVYPVPVAIGEGEEILALREIFRPTVAFFLGGIGPRGKNHYNLLAQRYGYADAAIRIEELWLDGKHDEAAALVPSELLELTGLIGPKSWVAERIAAYREAGATQLQITPVNPARYRAAADYGYNWNADRSAIEVIAQVKDLAG